MTVIVEVTAPAAPAPPARPWTSRTVRFLAEMAVAWFLSQVLQSLSDSALWLPKEWRLGVGFVISFFAATLCEMVAVVVRELLPPSRHAPHDQPADGPEAAHAVAEAHRRRVRVRLARYALVLLFVGLAGLGIWRSYLLRNQCVWTLNPPAGWWQQQFGADPVQERLHGHAAARREHGAAPHPGTGPSGGDEPAAAPAHRAASSDGPLVTPDFLNPERGTIYIPETFDPEMEEYLRSVGEGDLRDGIREVLDREPILMVDWLRGRGAGRLRETTSHFLQWHLLTVFCLGIAWGISRPKVSEVLPEGVKHFLHG
jgi:hypothetical protein